LLFLFIILSFTFHSLLFLNLPFNYFYFSPYFLPFLILPITSSLSFTSV